MEKKLISEIIVENRRREDFGDIEGRAESLLRSANPKYEDLIYDADLVEIKAIVIQSVKNWN